MSAIHTDWARVARRRALALVGALVFLSAGCPGLAFAQTTATPEQEYKKLIKVNEDIQPLGDTPFGEKISLYDGSLSFSQTDVTVTGTGPAITLGREFAMHGVEDRPDLQYRAFGDWDISLPQIFTVTANQNNVRGWRVAASNPNAICSSFGPPPSVAAPTGDSERADWEPQSWWQGYQLRIPGQGNQDLLSRSTANTATPSVNGLTYPIVTRANWAVGCLPQASNDATVQGFLAVSPDGTKYWLDHIAYRYMATLTRPLDSGPGLVAGRTNGVFQPQAAAEDLLTRREGRMLVTRIEDRFGNYVTYSYSGDDVTDIAASDGRHVTLTYQTDPATGTSSHRVNTITIQGGAAGTRTWTYSYVKSVANLVYTLTSVVQPDGSSWGYNLDPLNGAWPDSRDSGGTCAAIGVPLNMASTFTATMTHPSGLSGSFTVAPFKRGRANVPQQCMAGPNIPALPNYPGTWAAIPDASYNMAITSRVLSGAGLPSGGLVWNYGYSPPNDSWAPAGAPVTCTSTIFTDVTYPADGSHPAGHVERSTFSNCYDWTESQLKQEDVYDAGTDTARRRSTTYGYVNPAAQAAPGADARSAAYAHPWGYAPQDRINRAQLQEQIPTASRTVTLDPAASPTPDMHTWSATAFDAFARAQDVTRASNFGFSVSERSTFTDNAALWVIGLPAQTVNLTRNEAVSQIDYDPTTATPASRYQFGTRVMSYTFNAQGQLATFIDPLLNTTNLSGYVFGIPTSVTFPDKTPDHPNGTTETLTVDGFGQITSITDQTGATTSYAYDAIGRLGQITYPAGDTVAWAPKVLSYTFSADARGLGGNHLVRTVTQGTYAERVDFDALLRPVMTGKAETGTGALYVSTRTEYDWAGRKVLESYPVDGAPDRASITQGVSTAYDVLGRSISKSQSAEIVGVTTSTSYLPGGVRRVTDPNGNVVDTANQAFDQPVYDNPVRVSTSDGTSPVVQTIVRNVYGNPEQISQGGVVRKIYYDAQQRICRTFDPETQSEMTGYDAASNAIWVASGQPVNGDSFGCGYDQVAAAAKVSRTYDGMNRLATVSYPGGTVGLSFTYDPLGNPAAAVSTTAMANPNTTGTVNWSFGRNKRALLTAEVLSTGSMSWGIGYGYDPNGNLASTQYPDGKVVSSMPNALGQPTVAGAYATAAAYHPDGQLKSFAFGNGALYASTLNARNLLGNFTVGTAGGLVVSEDLAYDKNANVTTVHDLVGSGQRSRALTYDGLNRLSTANASALWGTESFTYDAANNIRSITGGGSTSTYNYDTINRLLSISGGSTHAFEYDVQGNTTKRDSQAMVFDLANRLLSVTGKGDYLYDSAGRRVRSVAPSGTTYYAYNAAGQLLWQFNPATNAGTDYVYLGKKLIASTSGAASSSTVPSLSAPSSALVNTAYTVAWTAVTGSTGYELQEQAGTGSWTTVASGTALSKSLTHTAAGTFHYQVRACNAGTCGAWSAQATTVVTATQGVPASPASISAVLSSDQQSFTVIWTASAGATSYNVEAFTGLLWNNIYAGPNLSTTMSAAADGTYNFHVSACNANGCSVWTAAGNMSLRHTPSTPSSLTVPPASTGSIAMSWGSSTYGLTYDLQQSSDNITYTSIYTGSGTSYTKLVQAAGTYYFRVRACNSGPCSGFTAVRNSTVTFVPTKPTVAVPASSVDGCYAVTWSLLGNATSYVLQEQVNSGTFATISNNGSGTLNICGKANGKYGYHVQACNVAGCSAFSNTASVTVLLPPAAPTGVQTVKTTLSASNIRFQGSWNAVSTASRYEVLKDATTLYSGAATTTLLQAGSSTVLVGSYSVRACNASGCSAYVPFPAP